MSLYPPEVAESVRAGKRTCLKLVGDIGSIGCVPPFCPASVRKKGSGVFSDNEAPKRLPTPYLFPTDALFADHL